MDETRDSALLVSELQADEHNIPDSCFGMNAEKDEQTKGLKFCCKLYNVGASSSKERGKTPQ